MQAQMQATGRPATTLVDRAHDLIAWIAGIHIVMHVMWYLVPQFTRNDEVGLTQYIVISTTLAIGLVALAGMWKRHRWGWWAMVVVTVLQLFLTLPEALFLEGVMRVSSIVAFAALIVTAALLFRPALRTLGR